MIREPGREDEDPLVAMDYGYLMPDGTPKIRATCQTNNEKTNETGQESRMHMCTSPKKRLSRRDNPRSHTPQHRLTTKPVPCTTSQGTRQQFNPWSKYGRNCSDDSSLETLSDFRSHHPYRFNSFESTGRFIMRLVTLCITERHPQTLAGATLPRAFNGVHADGQSTSRRPGPRAVNRREESILDKHLPLRSCSHDQLEFPSDRGRITTSPIHSWCNSPPM